MIDLRHGDCLELMRDIPDGSVDLVLCDPPYNIGVKSEVGGKVISHDWDRIDNYLEWSLSWMKEAERERKGSLFDMDALDAETERRKRA